MRKNVKLICIPYAGGSIISYLRYKPLLKQYIDFCPIELAGHGKRYCEPFYTSFSDAVEDIYNIICPDVANSTYIIFGHSMGSVLAYELTYKMYENGVKLPSNVIFSGRMPPKRNHPTYHYLKSDAEFEEELLGLGGTDRAVMGNEELKRLVLPIIKADYKLLDEYQYTDSREPLPIDFSIFYGKQDTSNNHLDEWAAYTNRQCEFYCFSGSHFFIYEQLEEVATVINNIIDRY